MENAKINRISNCDFFAGKVEVLFPQFCHKDKADVVFVDPPRSGLDNKTIDTLLKVKPDRIVYISCNPVSLVDNLKRLNKLYNIKEIQIKHHYV